MRILIFGANGLLGRDLVGSWTPDDVIPATSRDADIRDEGQVRGFVARERPDWIVLAAAYTDVDGSERDPDLAFSVNRDGTRNVSLAARELGAKLCYVSTDYVFDGASSRPYEPEDPVHPLNVYGASKLAGEQAVQEQAVHSLIVRTSWLFGTSRPCFPEKILSSADSLPELKVVNDQVGSPTYTKDLAATIRDLLRADARGILNISNSGTCSWFEFAKETLQRAGRDTTILPIPSPEAGRLARRPAYSALSLRALGSYGIAMRSWQEALGAYLMELRTQGKLR
ncbi:MAG TPA: dTDP-4-dehydrorhamnose reductase [Candidatus Limnocylindrales bacterium]|nr:dTDP-4-dehydrorhamnose reductase [Candidatus Limnocylindrales bacterium]